MSIELSDKALLLLGYHGFTQTDAKVFLALLARPGATGYELSSVADVPRSAVYKTLSKLASMGFITRIGDKPTTWFPLELDHLFGLLESRFQQNQEELKSCLADLVAVRPPPPLYHLQNADAIIEHAHTLLSESSESCVLSLWHSDALKLQSAMKKAITRGVRVVLLSFTNHPFEEHPNLSTYTYDVNEEELAKTWPRKIITISDHSTALIATTSAPASGVFTKDASIVEMAINNLVLDITLFGRRRNCCIDEAVDQLMIHKGPLEERLEERGH